MNRAEKKTVKIHLSVTALSLALAGVLVGGAAFSTAAFAVNPPVVQASTDSQVLDLLDKLAHSPECMNLQYLTYVIGHPANQPRNTIGAEKRYYWYGTTGKLIYEMVQSESAPGLVTVSTFTAFLPDNDLDLQEVEDKYGKGHRNYFDNRCHPTTLYSFVPSTTIEFTQPPDTFSVRRVKIDYRGTPLGPPSLEDLQALSNQRRQLAFDSHQHQNFTLAIPQLMAHLDEYPNDVEARVALAEALKQSSHINESIEQYQIAMKQSGGGPIADACRQGLENLRVLPSTGEEPPRHDLDVVAHGQRFRQGDESKNPPLAPQRQFGGMPGQPGMPLQPFTPPGAQSQPRLQPGELDIQPLEPPTLLPGGASIDPVVGF